MSKSQMVMVVNRPLSMPDGAKKGVIIENVPMLLVSKNNVVIYYEFGRNFKSKKNIRTWMKWKLNKGKGR